MLDAKQSRAPVSTAAERTGRLDLSFGLDPNGRTYLDKQYSSYPFHICRPFYLDDGPTAGMTTIYTQSCSGGLYTKDHLQTSVSAAQGTQVQLTTQASTIVHRSARGPARQTVDIQVGADALVEYLPDPAILFPDAHLQTEVRVQADSSASVVLCDSFLAHDFYANDRVFDCIESLLYLSDLAGKPFAIDRFRLTGSEFFNGAKGVMDGYPCHGSFVVVAPEANLADLTDGSRAVLTELADTMAGVSELPSGTGISARILSKDAVAMNAAIRSLSDFARVKITGTPPGRRRK